MPAVIAVFIAPAEALVIIGGGFGARGVQQESDTRVLLYYF